MARKLLAEDQVGLRPRQSTVREMFMIKILIEKHLQNQCDLFHKFINFRMAFNRVWLVGLWQMIRNKTNELVRKQTDTLAGKQKPLLAFVRCCNFSWY